jgi:hypothetical protein
MGVTFSGLFSVILVSNIIPSFMAFSYEKPVFINSIFPNSPDSTRNHCTPFSKKRGPEANHVYPVRAKMKFGPPHRPLIDVSFKINGLRWFLGPLGLAFRGPWIIR